MTTRSIETAVRKVTPADLPAIRALCEADPVVNVFVAARLAYACARGTFDPFRMGGDLLAYAPGGRVRSLCFVGGNLVPVGVDEEAIDAFAYRLARRARISASLVGEASAVLPLWERLDPSWGPAREVREAQPVLVIDGPPKVAPDPAVRPVQRHEVDVLFPAAVAMFIEEVGISPVADGDGPYHARVEELVGLGHAFARIEPGPDGRRSVVFKADVGYSSPDVCQVQGVWVRPDRRGERLAAPAMAAVVERAQRDVAPVVSLYVNHYNHVARRVYEQVGFRHVATFATVLL